ncbi:MAG: N-acetyltransferase [Chloroflexi bacterium]|nr:MAG: N-acetyltransferase [Chloroflexota bacterium]
MSHSFTLRPAQKKDADTIRQMIKKARLNPMGLDWRRFIVAIDENGRIIGCGQVKPHRDGSRELASLVVQKPWRKKGVARAIITHLQQQHHPPLWLMCGSHLIPFYTKHGFQHITNPNQMPPYFRRINHLFHLYSRLRPRPIVLAIMCWNPQTSNTILT